MRIFKLTKQKIFFNYDTIVDDSNRTHEITIEADYYKSIHDEILITESNIEMTKFINSKHDYKIGDIFTAPTTDISFLIGDVEIRRVNILADPYYKLEEFINEQWNIIDKHKCHVH